MIALILVCCGVGSVGEGINHNSTIGIVAGGIMCLLGVYIHIKVDAGED
jgi:hypothetical protein